MVSKKLENQRVPLQSNFKTVTKKSIQEGYLFGLFLILLMTVRVYVEKFKIPQVDGREDWILGLNTGQALSIPFILIGIFFIVNSKRKLEY